MKKPKFQLGDIVFVQSEIDKEKILQGTIKSAEFVKEWFYEIVARNPMKPCDEAEVIYTYEEDVGNAKTKILTPITP